MKYSWKGHKDRNRHKDRIKRSGQARLVANCWNQLRCGHKASSTDWFLMVIAQSVNRRESPMRMKHKSVNRKSKSNPRSRNTSSRAHLHVVGMLQFMSDIHQPSLPTPFYSVFVSISVFMALSTVFHFINSPDNSPFSHSVLVVLSLLYWSFQLYISSRKSYSALI